MHEASACYDTPKARRVFGRVEEVRRFLHRRRPGQCAFGPYAGEPADQLHHTTTHLLHGHHARKHTPRHSAVAAAATTTTTIITTTALSARLFVHARVRVARLRVVVKVSHLLAACGLLHSPVHASRLSSFKVYYVFAKNIGGGPVAVVVVWLYKGRPSRARLYLTRVYTPTVVVPRASTLFLRNSGSPSLSPHRGGSLICDTRRYAQLVIARNVSAQAAKVKLNLRFIVAT